jgi:osmotically-inducible protein OsmY
MKIINLQSVLLSLAVFLAAPAHAGLVSAATDTVNSGIINTKIVADDSLDGIEVDATVDNGIAIFSGEVESKAQINRLIRIARSVSGIKGVDVSRVKVVPLKSPD